MNVCILFRTAYETWLSRFLEHGGGGGGVKPRGASGAKALVHQIASVMLHRPKCDAKRLEEKKN